MSSTESVPIYSQNGFRDPRRSHMYDGVKKELRKEKNCFCMVLCVMQMEILGVYCEGEKKKTLSLYYYSVECVNGVKNGSMHECECGMILLGFPPILSFYPACAKSNRAHH